MAKDNSSSKLMMDKEQALGYMLLTCRELGISIEQVKQIRSNMIYQYNNRSPDEAKMEGKEWFHSILEKTDNPNKKNRLENQMPKTRFKRANVGIPKIPESNNSRKLRDKNQRIMEELQRMEDGPLGVFRLFKGCRRYDR